MSSTHVSMSNPNRPRRRAGIAAAVLGCAAAAALFSAGPASAASRAFVVHNTTNQTLKLDAAKPVPTVRCGGGTIYTHCEKTFNPFDFEGRPADGSTIAPSATARWDLKWGFSLFGGLQYAANIWYKVGDTGGLVEYTIMTYTTSNDSSCKVTGTTQYTCTAGGLDLTVKKS